MTPATVQHEMKAQCILETEIRSVRRSPGLFFSDIISQMQKPGVTLETAQGGVIYVTISSVRKSKRPMRLRFIFRVVEAAGTSRRRDGSFWNPAQLKGNKILIEKIAPIQKVCKYWRNVSVGSKDEQRREDGYPSTKMFSSVLSCLYWVPFSLWKWFREWVHLCQQCCQVELSVFRWLLLPKVNGWWLITSHDLDPFGWGFLPLSFS